MRLVLASTALALVTAACGGGGSPQGSPTTPTPTPTETQTTASPSPQQSSPAATCTPSGSSLELEAENIAFDAACLAAPAGRSFTLLYSNRDAVAHSFSIYRDSTAAEALFKGGNVAGSTEQTFTVPALPAGNGYFRCDIHPDDMNGAFVVA